MTELLLQDYQPTLITCGAMALLMLVQLIAADMIGIRARHVPGTPVEANHDNALFRASRVVANTNESVAIFVLLIVFALGTSASPDYTSYATYSYVAARVAYALCYYMNLQTPRSVMFGISIVSLAALFLVAVFT